jgi:hypothetical protein
LWIQQSLIWNSSHFQHFSYLRSFRLLVIQITWLRYHTITFFLDPSIWKTAVKSFGNSVVKS